MRIAAAFFGLCLLLSASAAMAGCACSPEPFERRWDAADAIFTAKVVTISELPQYIRKGNANDIPVRVIVTIDAAYKGPVTDGQNFELQTSLTRDTCTGHPFEKDVEYLIFAYKRDDNVYESWSLYNMPAGTYDVGGLCGGTKKVSDPLAAPEIEKLKEKAAEKKPEEKGLMQKMFGN